MSDANLGFQQEGTPSLSHSLIGFVSQAPDAERTFLLSALFRLFNGFGGATRPTTLTGGGSTALDGIAAGVLLALPNDYIAEIYQAEGVILRYRLRALADGEEEAAPWLIKCDSDAARCWELIGVSKQGLPCAYNADTDTWHRLWAVGQAGMATSSVDSTGFSI